MPATIRNVPIAMTRILHATMQHHLFDPRVPLRQLSYNHMQAMGWKQVSVPSRAPMSDTRASKEGMALAIMYAMTVTLTVHPSQVIQCVGELLVRWGEPRRRWTNMNLDGIYRNQRVNMGGHGSLTCATIVVVTINPGSANP